MGTANLTEQLAEGAKPRQRRQRPSRLAAPRVPRSTSSSSKPFRTHPPSSRNKQIKATRRTAGGAEGAPARPGSDDAPLLRTPLDARICICLSGACILGFLRHTLVYTFCYVMRMSCTQTDTWALQNELDYHEIKKQQLFITE